VVGTTNGSSPLVGYEPMNGPYSKCASYSGSALSNTQLTVVCEFPTAVGRYVFVQVVDNSTSTDPLCLCEVEVYVEMTGMYTFNCEFVK